VRSEVQRFDMMIDGAVTEIAPLPFSRKRCLFSAWFIKRHRALQRQDCAVPQDRQSFLFRHAKLHFIYLIFLSPTVS
jgi:hypothetical protein